MNRNYFCLLVIIVVMYFTMVFSKEALEFKPTSALQNRGITDLEDGARTRKHRHHLWYIWSWYALSIAYWIKVKLIVVGFFVGSAIFVALRYYSPSRCSTGVVHDSPTILYDHHPPSFAYDHIPYSLDHSPQFDHSADPYSAYGDSYSEDITATAEELPSTLSRTHRIKRQTKSALAKQHHRETMQINAEERIAELIFEFLGLDSVACRRRFICEMEFRSRLNPLTSMAFRIVGRGFFEKYTNERNDFGHANSFKECAAVNTECVFIEQNVEEEISTEDPGIDHVLQENQENPTTSDESLNEANFEAERKHQRNIDSNDLKYKSVASLILDKML